MAVIFRAHVSGAQVGIALNIMLVANTTLLKLVENWTTLEISLGAIARLKTLEQMTPTEGGKASNLEPAEDWPSRGHIAFENITASYKYVACPKINFLDDINKKYRGRERHCEPFLGDEKKYDLHEELDDF